MLPFYSSEDCTLFCGDVLDCLKEIEKESVQTVVTSPPYYQARDYKVDGQIGLEKTPKDYVEKLVVVFREVRRTLRKDGTFWLNLGQTWAGGNGIDGVPNGWQSMSTRNRDKYPSGEHNTKRNAKKIGYKRKDMISIPWMAGIALQQDGWYLRSDIIWDKIDGVPSNVTDRPTLSHEYILLLTKSPRYYYDYKAIAEPAKSGGTRNKRSVWHVRPTKQHKSGHFATFSSELIEPCILAGSREGDTVLDPFVGTGTTCEVSLNHKRKVIGIDIKQQYIESTLERLGRKL